jgi:hypothetical protein
VDGDLPLIPAEKGSDNPIPEGQPCQLANADCVGYGKSLTSAERSMTVFYVTAARISDEGHVEECLISDVVLTADGLAIDNARSMAALDVVDLIVGATKCWSGRTTAMVGQSKTSRSLAARADRVAG